MDASAQAIRRYPKLEDKGFILKTWLMGNYYGDWHYGQINQDLYYELYTEKITKILSNPKTKVELACLEEDPNMVLGYIVWRDKIIIWSFVKPEYRNKGIFNFLIESKDIKFAASVTKPGLAIIKKKRWIFNPFILKESENE